MKKFLAVDCRQFEGSDITTVLEGAMGAVHQICSRARCVDRKDCDGEIKEEQKEIHFEPKIPPPGQEEFIEKGI